VSLRRKRKKRKGGRKKYTGEIEVNWLKKSKGDKKNVKKVCEK
jgi:hypothetical protein